MSPEYVHYLHCAEWNEPAPQRQIRHNSTHRRNLLQSQILRNRRGFPCGSAGKESTWNAGPLGLTPGLGRSLGEGESHPLQYSGLENFTDCIIHGVAKNPTWLSDFHFHFQKVERGLPGGGGRERWGAVDGSRLALSQGDFCRLQSNVDVPWPSMCTLRNG